MKPNIVFALLTAYLLTGCVQYASGYKKVGGGSADSKVSGGGETCLKLAEKRKAHLKLQDEEEVVEEEEEVTDEEEIVDDEEVVEDTESCTPADEEVVDEEVVDEEVVDEEVVDEEVVEE